MKEEKNLRKSFNSSNLLQSIELQREKPWFHQKPTKIFDGQPLQHKIVRLLNAGPRIRPTYSKLALSRSTTDLRLVLGPAFGSQTILCCMGNHSRPLASEIMNIFNGRPWFDHAALCCKESLNKIFFGEIFLKIWLRFEKFYLKNNPK